MALLLNIDTSLETACISISENGILLSELVNKDQKSHSSFLQPAIKEILQAVHKNVQQIDVVAVTEGPGSYTGLRVGMAAAKGICFALSKPLITINTLEALAATAIGALAPDAQTLICPMIDARRMEVYTAIYDKELVVVSPPAAIILKANALDNYFSEQKIIFIGSGAEKWNKICCNPQATHFQNMEINSSILNNLSYKKYISKKFADIAYAEPFYLKEFFTTAIIKS